MDKLDRTWMACIKRSVGWDDCGECPIMIECVKDQARTILGPSFKADVIFLDKKTQNKKCPEEMTIATYIWYICSEFMRYVAYNYAETHNIDIDDNMVYDFIWFYQDEVVAIVNDMHLILETESDKKYSKALIRQKLKEKYSYTEALFKKHIDVSWTK